jgi:hypothetical protein
MVSTDIKRALEIIEQRISSLEQIKRMLIDEFGINGSTPSIPSIEPPKTLLEKMAEGTRKESVIKLLKTEGPLLRRDIMARTGFPAGTIAFVLNDKDIFTQTKDRKWTLKD